MYTIADISAFREQIFANAAFLLQEKKSVHLDASRSLEIITVSKEENSYTGTLVDLSTGKVLYEGQADPNPAQAIHYLFDVTSQAIGKRLNSERKEEEKLAERKK